MARWVNLKHSIAELFRPCYVPGQSEFEKSANKVDSSTKDQNLNASMEPDSAVEERTSEDSLGKHSYFPDIPSSEDLLGFKSYAKTLADLIADRKTQTPLTIGIFGSWGSGKSTLMQMIQSELKQRNQHSKQHFVLIRFNAWKYSREDALHRAIILRVLDSLRPEDDNSLNPASKQNPVSKHITTLEQRLYRDVEWEEKGRLTLDWPKVIRGGAGSAFKLSYSFLPGLSGLTEAVKAAQGAFGKGDIANDTATLFEAFQRDVVKHHQVQLRHIEQFQEQFDTVISTYFPNERIVIFVDDLDRCLPEKTIEVLEAIKLFMDVKRCVFVLGLDQQIISRAIQHRYKDLQPEERKKLAFDGIRYLEKIVQLPFMLPSIEIGDMHNYVDSLNADWPETPPETSCSAILAESLPSNPRQVKRTINVFLLIWKLAENRREKIGNTVTPLRLVKVVVLQTAYPTLFEELKLHPLLLSQLEAYFAEPKIQNTEKHNVSETPLQSEDPASDEIQSESSKYDLATIHLN
ncbi:MAG: P-loop NTPase fold protein, partial [Bacteroidota bacterium]